MSHITERPPDTCEIVAGRYRFERCIASGGQADVWSAHDERSARPVAVKLLRSGALDDEAARKRFERETRTVTRLSHPNVVALLDWFEEDGALGTVMELVEGGTLADRIRRVGPLTVREGATIGASLLAALDAAHRAGVLHRDVKPSNVLIGDDGVAKITDFGVATIVDEPTLTDPDAVVGSAHYLAPERLRGCPASAASDVYSTGVLLYEALTGARPFAGETAALVALARLHEDPVPVREHRPELPGAVADVVMGALRADPSKRFPTAMRMRRALEHAAREATNAGHHGGVARRGIVPGGATQKEGRAMTNGHGGNGHEGNGHEGNGHDGNGAEPAGRVDRGGQDFDARARELARSHLRPAEERGRTTARGIHHLALICHDADRTIRFYQDVLGWPLVDLVENRDHPGSAHFFFDIGHGNLLAFFDFPGLELPEWEETLGSMQHVAVSVLPEAFEQIVERLRAEGVEHMGADEAIPDSVYFHGPDGERVEILREPLGEMGGRPIG